MPSLVALTVADPPEVWSKLGFSVVESEVRVGAVCFRCAGSVSSGAKGITDWVLADPHQTLPERIDGVPTAQVPSGAGVTVAFTHPNGVRSIDHLVLRTPDLERTVAILEGIGVSCRRRRTGGAYGSSTMLQAFFWLGLSETSDRVLLEVVGESVVDPHRRNDPAQFFGIAFACADLDATVSFFGDLAKPPVDAVQPGRRITSISSRAGSSVAIALMSEHVDPASLP